MQRASTRVYSALRQMNPEKVDVLISGGGPVGLYFACRMASLGHSFYLCDKKGGPTTETRALGITPRTMEIMERYNIASHLMKEAVIIQGMQAYIDGAKIGTIDTDGDTIFPYLAGLPQSKTETILTKLLGGERVSRETELVSYEQNDEGVDAIVRNLKDGTEKQIHAKYIIGADGSHSAVRKLNKSWTYEGVSVTTRFVVGDVWMSGKDLDKISHYRGNIFVHPKGLFGALPSGEKDGRVYYRIFANLSPYEQAPNSHGKRPTHGLSRDDHLSPEEAQEILKERVSPFDITVRPVNGFSIFRINERKANGYRRNRAFLMGDAAHCHSPVGGQGLNLGLQDATNLAWKLSLVLNGRSSDSEKLLDSYSEEREPIAEATLKNTGGASRVGFSGGMMSSVFRFVAPFALSLDYVKKIGITAVMQLETHIPDESSLVAHEASKSIDLIKPGQFINETSILRKRAITKYGPLERRTLHQILQDDGIQHTVVFVGTRPSSYDPCPWTQEFWNKFVAQDYPANVAQPLVVESAWHGQQNKVPEYVTAISVGGKPVEEAYWLEESYNLEHSISKRVGLFKYISEKPEPPAAIVVVRPDQYVAYSGLIRSTTDIDKAFQFLDRYLRKGSN
ncbi:FAD binding domain-containing protein [Fennellomyces sp. T-0311]|nr:FAD binding domain-containing protein [Fennellomyces sp. T-0311]